MMQMQVIIKCLEMGLWDIISQQYGLRTAALTREGAVRLALARFDWHS